MKGKEKINPVFIGEGDTSHFLMDISINKKSGSRATGKHPSYGGFTVHLFGYDEGGKYQTRDISRGEIFLVRVTHQDHHQTHVIVLADSPRVALRIVASTAVAPIKIEILTTKLAVSA